MYRNYSIYWRQDIGWRSDEIHFEPVIFSFDDIGSDEFSRYRGPQFHDKQEVIQALKKEIKRLENEPEFTFADEELQRLPHVGAERWGVRELCTRDEQKNVKVVGREVLPLEVDSHFIKNGELFIAHSNFFLKKPSEVFETEEEANEHMEKLGGPLTPK